MDNPPSQQSESPPYGYRDLKVHRKEIRLAELLPAQFDDAIRLRIHTIELMPFVEARVPPPIFTTEILQSTVPKGWAVHETITGRFLFEDDREYGPMEGSEIYWTHPVTGTMPVANDPNLPWATPAYEALSHVWGDVGVETTISIDDPTLNYVNSTENQTRSLRIPEDLATALRHLRKQKASRMMWIDNICINQANIVERNHQVHEMGNIYKLAARVIVWLGKARDNSHLAMSTLSFLGQQVEIADRGNWRFNSPECQEPTWSRTMTPLPYDNITWEAIQKLLQRSWFNRVWVWQEAKLANYHSIIQCGHDLMPLYVFAKATWCAAAKTNTLPDGLQHLLFAAGDSVLPRFNDPFLMTLLHLQNKNCLDPRDKVYGALGLAPPQIASQVEPNYGNSVAQLYRDFCITLNRETHRLDFLLACDLATRAVKGPTWTPDWSTKPVRLRPRWLFNTVQASGISMSEAKVTELSSDVLFANAVYCGTITTIGARAPSRTNDMCSILRLWANEIAPEATYINGEKSIEAFVKTIYWNILRERCPEDHSLPTLTAARNAIQQILAQERPSANTVTEKEDLQYRATGTTYLEAWDRSFIKTANGYIGLTSAVPSINDKVYVILGCPLPVILRPTSTGDYLVVGTAYVHGLMNAESLLGHLDQSWVIEAGISAARLEQIRYRNIHSNITTKEDPRLGDVPSSWVEIREDRVATDPIHFVRYRNFETGRTINSNPRLLPAMLLKRGVKVDTIRLI